MSKDLFFFIAVTGRIIAKPFLDMYDSSSTLTTMFGSACQPDRRFFLRVHVSPFDNPSRQRGTSLCRALGRSFVDYHVLLKGKM
jgi:hypothetical protein